MEFHDTDIPLDADPDLSDDDWVPLEMFRPAGASDRSTADSRTDPSAPSESAGNVEPAPAAADLTPADDLVLPQMSELWPGDVAPTSSADSSEGDNDRVHHAVNVPLADALAATMLQTAESFAAGPPQPADSLPTAPLQRMDFPPAAAPQPPPVIAAPLPPAESLTTTPLQHMARETSAASGEAAPFRPWVADLASPQAPAAPPVPIPAPRPPIPATTFAAAPPIPPSRSGSPEAVEVPAPRSVETRAVMGPPPPQRAVSAAPPAARPATQVAAAARSFQMPQATAPPARVEPAEARVPRAARPVQAASQPQMRSAEPLAAVKRSLAVLEKLLAMTVSCGAGTLYLAADTRPTIRVHGEVQTLAGTPVLARQDVETLLRSLLLAQNTDPQAAAPGAEWCFDLPGAGRVRCMTFQDHRGRGAIFRIGPRRAVAAEQLGLPVEVQSLAMERDGLVLVAGPRSSGKGAVVAGLLDLINRTRRAYVITIEREVNVSPEREASFISQREARGGLEEMVAVARAALRENPDVLVLQELRSAALMNLAFDAAASGQLVIAGFTAPSAGGAIERIIKLYPRDSARGVQLLLSQHLRAVISQVLVPRIAGGRTAAREILLNTSAVASALADGKAWQIPGAIEAGRSHGMVTFSESLAALVQAGTVAAGEAYRHAADRAGFLEALKRHGIDPAAAMRLP